MEKLFIFVGVVVLGLSTVLVLLAEGGTSMEVLVLDPFVEFLLAMEEEEEEDEGGVGVRPIVNLRLSGEWFATRMVHLKGLPAKMGSFGAVNVMVSANLEVMELLL